MSKSNVESLIVASTPTIDSSEILVRARRSHNVIVRRVVEDSDPGSDLSTVTKVLELVVPSNSKYLVPSSSNGSENRRGPRPILVSLSDPITARDILRNKKLLSTSEMFKKVTMTDVFPKQTECLKKAPEDLKLRQSQGEQNLTIKYLKGVPTVISIKNIASSKN
ncbi:hypothetical protein HHI36_004413 [Cryptolaemus montrouzieri]|uniref:Uncharacterized protein n=1 Tax=Cryptolaemus montrouzieri TaxID=559131 RepID=A0ABD2NR43_9CUCU